LYNAREKIKEFSKQRPPNRLKLDLANEYAESLREEYNLGTEMLLELILLVMDEETEIGGSGSGRILSGKDIKKIMGISPEIKTELDEDDFIQLNRLMTKEQLLSLYKSYKAKIKTSDTRSNIVRDRDWYWLNKEGNSYGKIWKMELKKKKGERITQDGVARAIQKYKEKLTMNV
jgi:hypothetical protein